MEEDLFAAYARDHGADPEALAADLAALVRFLGRHDDLARSPALLEAAMIFLGNAIIAAHPYARWQLTDQPEIAGPAMNIVMRPTTRDVILVPGRGSGLLATLAGWPQARHDEQEFESLAEIPDEPLSLPAVPFVRPPLPKRTYDDENGEPIPYGSRYPDGPPEDAYSRVSHPERFAPLVDVVEALVAYVGQHYTVEVRRRSDDSGGERIELLPLTGTPIMVDTTRESVRVTAGALLDAVFPDCSCDACDETAETAADGLEETLLGIVGGGLREHYPVGARRWVHVHLQTPAGRNSGGGGVSSFTAAQDREIRAKLATLVDGHWPAWTLRS